MSHPEGIHKAADETNDIKGHTLENIWDITLENEVGMPKPNCVQTHTSEGEHSMDSGLEPTKLEKANHTFKDDMAGPDGRYRYH